MRDFYDIRMLLTIYKSTMKDDVFRQAFDATCKKRKTEYLKTDAFRIIASIETDANLKLLWNSYQKKYPYAADISFNEIIDYTKVLWEKIR